MWKTPFAALFIFYTVYLWFKTFGGAVLPTHFLREGLSLPMMMGGMVCYYFSQIIFLLVCKKLSARVSYLLAVVSSCLLLDLVIKIHFFWQYYLAMACGGASLFFFFVFYNISYFENTPKEKIGRNSALMFSIPTVVNIVAPLLAGVLAQISMSFIWGLSLIFVFPVVYLIFRQKNFVLSYSVRESLSEIKATRVLIFLEGIWEALIIGIIPIYTLFFIKTPLGYGTYLAYLSLVGIVANITLGKWTDRIQKRVVFLYPLTIAMAVSTGLFMFVQNHIFWWLVLTAAIQFLLPLFWNISTAMVVDVHPNLRMAIPGRELVLAVGRLLGLTLAFASFSWEKTPFWIYPILGGVILLYPVILRRNIKKKIYQYL